MSLDLDLLRRTFPGRELRYFTTLDSTMSEAARMALSGCTDGSAVIAEEQTAGQGRYGRQWHSEKDSGLYVSIVLRPRLPSEALPALTLALGLATTEAISRITGLSCDLRWPNDILVQERKAAGILVQLVQSCAIAGIGINVNHTEFPGGIAGEATSLRLAAGSSQSRDKILIALLPAVDSFVTMLVEGGRQGIFDAFIRRSSYARDKRVRVNQGSQVLVGTTAGLDPSGFLMVRQDDGTESVILSGGVRPA